MMLRSTAYCRLLLGLGRSLEHLCADRHATPAAATFPNDAKAAAPGEAGDLEAPLQLLGGHLIERLGRLHRA